MSLNELAMQARRLIGREARIAELEDTLYDQQQRLAAAAARQGGGPPADPEAEAALHDALTAREAALEQRTVALERWEAALDQWRARLVPAEHDAAQVRERLTRALAAELDEISGARLAEAVARALGDAAPTPPPTAPLEDDVMASGVREEAELFDDWSIDETLPPSEPGEQVALLSAAAESIERASAPAPEVEAPLEEAEDEDAAALQAVVALEAASPIQEAPEPSPAPNEAPEALTGPPEAIAAPDEPPEHAVEAAASSHEAPEAIAAPDEAPEAITGPPGAIAAPDEPPEHAVEAAASSREAPAAIAAPDEAPEADAGPDGAPEPRAAQAEAPERAFEAAAASHESPAAIAAPDEAPEADARPDGAPEPRAAQAEAPERAFEAAASSHEAPEAIAAPASDNSAGAWPAPDALDAFEAMLVEAAGLPDEPMAFESDPEGSAEHETQSLTLAPGEDDPFDPFSDLLASVEDEPRDAPDDVSAEDDAPQVDPHDDSIFGRGHAEAGDLAALLGAEEARGSLTVVDEPAPAAPWPVDDGAAPEPAPFDDPWAELDALPSPEPPAAVEAEPPGSLSEALAAVLDPPESSAPAPRAPADVAPAEAAPAPGFELPVDEDPFADLLAEVEAAEPRMESPSPADVEAADAVESPSPAGVEARPARGVSSGRLPEPPAALGELRSLSDDLIGELQRQLRGEATPAPIGAAAAPPPPDFDLEPIPGYDIESAPVEEEPPPDFALAAGEAEVVEDPYDRLLDGLEDRKGQQAAPRDRAAARFAALAAATSADGHPPDPWSQLDIEDLRGSGRPPPPPRLERAVVEVEHGDAAEAFPNRQQRVELAVKVGLEHGHSFFTGFSGNISSGGLFVATHQLLEMGSRVDLFFEMPDGHQISVTAEVRWVREYNPSADDQMPGMGFRFVGLPPDDQARVQRYIDEHESLFYDD